jgi:hypothetical protein
MKRFVLYVALVGVFLTSCGNPGGNVPADNPQDVLATIVASTIQALPSPTPYPTSLPTRDEQTPRPPTVTPITIIDASPVPSITPLPLLPTPGAVPTIFRKYYTATPISYYCKPFFLKPEWGETLHPREYFQAVWKVSNIGSAIWKFDQVEFFFVQGDKMHKNPEDAVQKLGYTVYPDDKIAFRINMIAPKEPGTYSMTWGLRKGKNVFCYVYLYIHVAGSQK